MIEKPKIHPFQHYDLHLMQPDKADLLGHRYRVATIAAQVADMADTAIIEAIIHAAADAGITDLYLIDKTFIREAIQEKLDRENPKPLTIEELRQMDGEPVWVSDRKYPSDSGYCVIRAPKDTFSDHGDRYCIAEIPGCECGWHEFEKYGVDWIAYRHKPKEGAK